MTIPIELLRTRYAVAYKIIRSERRMREHVFRNDPITRAAKLKEMDDLLSILDWMKDGLKPYCEAGYEQEPLIEVLGSPKGQGDYI
jgi:hypothetical protein